MARSLAQWPTFDAVPGVRTSPELRTGRSAPGRPPTQCGKPRVVLRLNAVLADEVHGRLFTARHALANVSKRVPRTPMNGQQ